MSTGRVPTIQRTIVRGALAFPIDMLRYDAAWPASESSSHLIEASIAHDTNGPVEVIICHRKPLTAQRWESFGWTIAGPSGTD
jgi:hypothetical protein